MHRLGFKNSNPVRRDIYEDILRLDSLAADLTIINTVPFPTEQVVAKLCSKAPILEDWRLAARVVPCLVGNSFGHPVLEGDDRHIATSEAFLISEELNCARSSSRWYRLGRPADGKVKD